MKKWLLIIAALAVSGYVAYSLHLLIAENRPVSANEYRVLIAYHKAYRSKSSGIMDAYQSVLAEEGVPCEAVDIKKLCAISAGQAAKNIPAVIFPDSLLQSMPGETLAWTKDYLQAGGSVAVIYDAGAKREDADQKDRPKSVLTDVTGVQYPGFSEHRGKKDSTGRLQFHTQEDADFFRIPPGKLSENFALSGYYYGELTYPALRVAPDAASPPERIFAHLVTDQGKSYPALAWKKHGRGNVLYSSLPLGRLKASSADDLPLRVFLQTFLFQIVKMPHLVNAYQGRGNLVINWQANSNGDWQHFDPAINSHYFDRELKASLHIAAADYRDAIGDGSGFDACGNGKLYVQKFMPYGLIGAHGGWGVNRFAVLLKKNRLRNHEIRRQIKRNKKCLESVANYNLTEYSAPLGAHPQPAVTEILENMGFIAYYFPGDGGSAPNRTFFDGKMVSEKVIAFPMQPYGKFATLHEMKQANIPEKDVQKWLMELVDYVVEKRTSRVFSCNLHDLFNYPQAVYHFLQYAKLKQAKGELQAAFMSEIASFLLRFLKTQYVFRPQENGLSVWMKNEDGLQGVTVAIPKHLYRTDAMPNVTQLADDDYFYLTVRENDKEKTLFVHGL